MADRAQARGGRRIRRRVVEIDREGQFGLFSTPPASSRPEAEAEPPRFVHPDPRTIFLGGVRLDDYLRQAGLTAPFVVRALLADQDWSSFRARYPGGGRRPYDPQPMVGLVLSGLMKGLSSLRELEALARTDLGTMWVTGGICPDHSVIGRFVLLHAESIEGPFLEELTRGVLRVTRSDTDTLAGDGTVVAAQASRFGTLKREALAEAAREARDAAERQAKTPREVGAEADAARQDAAPEHMAQGGAVQSTGPVDASQEPALPESAQPNEAAAEAARYEAALAVLDGRAQARQGKGKSAEGLSLHPGEPEAVVQPLKDKKTFVPAYKPLVLANKARVVVASGVHPSSETAELSAHLARARALGPVATLLLDAGFFSDGVIALSAEHDIELLCPEGQSLDEGEWTKQSKKKFAKSRFVYEAPSDSYVCPAGERLERIGSWRGSGAMPGYDLYGTKACAQCPLRARCTKSASGRQIKRYAGDAAKEALRAKLTTPEARARYRQRQAIVEPVFAFLKDVQGLRRFRRSGLLKVRLEFALHIAAYNLSRAVALAPALAGLREVLDRLAALWMRLLRRRRARPHSGARPSPAQAWLSGHALAAA
jgi:transposase